MFLWVDFHSAQLFFSYYSLFWPPEMIVNIIGDVYRSILIFTVFGIFHFWAFLAIFGQFWHFWGFSGDLGGFGSASEL